MAEKETIEEVFSNLTDALYQIKANGNVRLQSGYIYRIKLDQITSKIWDCKLNEALSYTNLALKDISEIKSLNSSLLLIAPEFDENEVNEYLLDDDGMKVPDWEGEPIQLPTTKEQYQFDLRDKESNEKEINRIESELIKLKYELTERINFLEASGRDKIKLNLTVEEIGILFAAFEQNKIITIPNKKALSRLITETFSSKDKDEFKPDKLYNSFTTFNEKSLDAMSQYLGNMLTSIEKFKEKIQR